MLARIQRVLSFRYIPGHRVVGEQKPEAEDRLGENIEDSIGDNFSVNACNAGAIGDTPDANT